MQLSLFAISILVFTMMSMMSTTTKAFFCSTSSSSRKLLLRSQTIRSMTSMIDAEQLMKDMLFRVRQVNQMPEEIKSTLLDFQLDGISLGKVRPKMVQTLCDINVENVPVFEVKKEKEKQYLTLSSKVGSSVDERTKAVSIVMDKLREDGIIKGWRDEVRFSFFKK